MSTTEGTADPQAWFDRWVDTYDTDRRVLIPCFDEFYGTAAEVASLGRTGAVRVLDLGAGTGLLSGVLAGALPDASFVLLDEAPAMLERAAERLAPLGDRVTTVVADLRDDLPEGPFDVVASALAIHHLDDAGKADLYRGPRPSWLRAGCSSTRSRSPAPRPASTSTSGIGGASTAGPGVPPRRCSPRPMPAWRSTCPRRCRTSSRCSSAPASPTSPACSSRGASP